MQGSEVRPQNDTARLPRNIHALTGLRGVAALWVYIFHLLTISAAFGQQFLFKGSAVLVAGWTAVDLFFVLSGFVLLHAHRADVAIVDRATYLGFMGSRLLRVYPLSIVATLLSAVLLLSSQHLWLVLTKIGKEDLSLLSFLRTVTLSTRWTVPGSSSWNEPIWSLSVEVIGYALFLPIAAMVRRCGTRLLAAGVVLSVFAVLLYLALTGDLTRNDLTNPGAFVRMICYFSAGIFLRELVERLPAVSDRTADLVGLAASLGLLVVVEVPGLLGFSGIAFVLVVFAVCYGRGRLAAILASAPAMLLGRLSFSLYLLHVIPVWYYASTFGPVLTPLSYVIGMMALTAALLAVSWLLHHGVERRTHAWGRRVAARFGGISRKTSVFAPIGDPSSRTGS